MTLGTPLEDACDTTQSRSVRDNAWNVHELNSWAEAVSERGFPFNALPQEFKDQVYESLVGKSAGRLLDLDKKDDGA